MKILATQPNISIDFHHKNLYTNNKNNKIISLQQKPALLPAGYYFPINFKGDTDNIEKQLKQLEAYNLIIRKEYPQIPPKVEYDLSEVGKNFLPVLDSIKDFGNKYIDYLQTRQ